MGNRRQNVLRKCALLRVHTDQEARGNGQTGDVLALRYGDLPGLQEGGAPG